MDDMEGKFPLHDACREGKASVVESLINVGLPISILSQTLTPSQTHISKLTIPQANPKLPNTRDLDSRLPLHWACSSNSLPCITLLAAQLRTFDPDAADASGWTPLMISASLPQSAGLPAATLLLSKSASVDAKTHAGQTALFFACSKALLDVSRLLIAHGASTRVRDKRGQLPLMRAAAVGSVPLVRLLLENKSPVNTSDGDGMTALHHAVSEGHGDVAVELLKAGAEADRRDREERLAIELAPDTKVRKFIIAQAEKEGIEL